MAGSDFSAALVLLNQLQPALQRRDRARQVDIVRRLVELHAPMGAQWQRLFYVALGNGEIGLARQAIDLLVEAAGGGAKAQFHKVTLLTVMGAWRDADALLQILPEDVPDPATHAYMRGLAALNLGKPEEARPHLERATQLQPQNGAAWLALAMSADLSREPALADRIIAAGRIMKNAAQNERVPYLHALAKAHADRGEHALAFAACANGAREQESSVVYNSRHDSAEAETAVEGYSAERVAAIARQQSEPTGQALFVTGLPRSGTTLVEQVLTSHSTVCDGAETNWLYLLAKEVGGRSWPALSSYVETQGAAQAARLWQHWVDELSAGQGRVVEKSVTTSRYLGMAAALLPEAPLIWMTRDPIDRAWSCFRTNFSGGAMPWSYNLQDIAAHFRIEDRLLERWRAILGDRLLVVPYEELVTGPEQWIRRILAHCQLSEEPGVFAPHENRRAVPTASMVQVRKPINRDAIGSAEPYREFLKPFIEAYYR
jgi:thioredoxin-like negative regulator of GroEL